MDKSCLFCQIANGILPSTKYYEDKEIIGIKNINPEAPFHALILPRKHIELARAEDKNIGIYGKLMLVASIVSKNENLKDGYRLIINIGNDSNRDFDHLHVHLVGGQNLGRILPQK